MSNKLKLLTFYTPSHELIYKEFFAKSYMKHLSNSFDLYVKKADQLSPNGEYGSMEFAETMFYKIEHILDHLTGSSGDIIVYSDCDVQFFGDFKDDIIELIDDNSPKSLLLQNDVTHLCAGFMVIRDNPGMRFLFERLLDELRSHYTSSLITSEGERVYMDDQYLLNKNISHPGRKMQINRLNDPDYKGEDPPLQPYLDILPDRYFTIGMVTKGKQFIPPTDDELNPEYYNNLNIPKDILIHHGNWTVGIDNKIKVLDLIRRYVHSL